MSAQTVADEETAALAEVRNQDLQSLKLGKQLAKTIMTELDEARTVLLAAVPPAPRPPEVDTYINNAINNIQALHRMRLSGL